ncbi:MAG TPA: DUF664 domain-containing protein [Dermatophilaceae bacterium]|nr:DUF664 domain-containing protein [Dermatophilaceae bacterium]
MTDDRLRIAPANALLIDAFGRVAESVPEVLAGLTLDELAWRPGPDANPIGWLVWHLTRVLDDHLADVSGLEQVWTSQGYAARASLPLADSEIGYGHSSEQVGLVHVPGELLAAYFTAVLSHFTPYLRDAADWERIVDRRWDPPVTLAVRLVSLVDECARHIGQAQYVKGLLPTRT